ncbi:MAG: hypothetical protein JW736_05630 [Deltaproteobacteria bacterium]|nr:hypothetical protein [Deltaproteobacteria bacterium]
MKRLILLLTVLLLVFSLACSLTGGKEDEPSDTPVPTAASKAEDAGEGDQETEVPAAKPQDEATEEPTKEAEKEEPETSEGDDEEDAGFHIDTGALAELKSYRSEMVITFKSKDGTTDGGMTIVQETTTDPPAQRVLMGMQGTFPGAEDMGDLTGGESFEIEVIVIEDKQWLRFGDMWMQTSASSEDAVDPDSLSGLGETFLNPEDLNSLADEQDLKYIGKETVNGIKTRHYHAVYDSLWGQLGLDDEDIESGEADIWIADEAGLPQFVVRMNFEIEGKLDLDDAGEKMDGTMTMEMEVTDINQPVTIEVPEDAMAGGLPEGVPEYPNAQEMNALGDMVSITTKDDEETVKAFYNDALEGAGWTLGEETMFGSTWTKDGRELTLMVTYDEDADITNVLIMLGEEGE